MKTLLSALLLFAFVLSSQNVKAQGETVTLDPVQVSVNFLPLMAHLEFQLGEKTSATLGGGLAYSAFFESVNGESSFSFYSSPFVTNSFRKYYTRNNVKRDDLRNNSGNYYGLLSTFTANTLVVVDDEFVDTDLASFTVGPVWGIQRNYASGLHLDLSLGLGYQTGQSDSFIMIENAFTFIGGFELGFRLNK